MRSLETPCGPRDGTSFSTRYRMDRTAMCECADATGRGEALSEATHHSQPWQADRSHITAFARRTSSHRGTERQQIRIMRVPSRAPSMRFRREMAGAEESCSSRPEIGKARKSSWAESGKLEGTRKL